MRRLAFLAVLLSALTLAPLALGIAISREMGDPFASWWFSIKDAMIRGKAKALPLSV